MSNIEIRQPEPDELIKVQQLRHAVLDPARQIETDRELTPDDFAEGAVHMAAFASGEVVGTVRLDRVPAASSTYEVRKMAVLPAARSRGLGRRVMEAALHEAGRRGATAFTLDARKEAIPFFEKLGFALTGEVVVHEDGVPNYVMKRTAGTA